MSDDPDKIPPPSVPPAEGEHPLVDGVYRVDSVIGQGGMGIVLLARDERLNRDVALKLINRGLLEVPGARERFVEEARAMAGVRHENVVQIYSLGEYADVPYFAMEYVPGPTVAEWLDRYDRGDEPSVDEVLGILDQLCRGLDAIHDARIVHADVKPGNVLIGPAFRVAVTDFGLVRALGMHDESNLVVGTPAYIAPEVVYSKTPVFDRRADVYSLGVMAYEMFTGCLPYPIDSVGQLFRVHEERIPAPVPSELRGDLPQSFDAVLLRALERDPDARYPSAKAFRRALLAAREEMRLATPGFRIVVADDDPDYLALAKETLEFAFPGGEIECVADGDAALASLDTRPASLALVDLDMPGLNGVELTAAIRARRELAKMPILVVTARGGAPDWRLLQSLGADGFLVKPIDPFSLIAAARRVLDR